MFYAIKRQLQEAAKMNKGKFIKKLLQPIIAVATMTLLVFTLLADIIVSPSAPVIASTTYTYNIAGTYTWIAPTGVTSVTVEVWGAGGRGGRRTSNGVAGGGGGGAYSMAEISVTPGDNYNVTVGAGGSGTAASPPDGGDSWFNDSTSTYVLAKGGRSVATNSITGASGGAEADGVGDTRYSGGNGANGVGGNYGGGGGSSAGTGADGTNATDWNGADAPDEPDTGGDGGNGRQVSQGRGAGQNGVTPGGGGGGAYRNGNKQNGGNGATGQVRITIAMDTYINAGTYTWTAPTGVYAVTVEVWGGGGKGGNRSGSNGAGGGGGGGAYSLKSDIVVTPGNSYTVVVGAGSSWGSTPGGDSYFIDTSTVMAKGGNSVPNNTTTGASGGVAASGVGDTCYSGGNGANGVAGSYGGGGGSSAGTGQDGNNGSGSTGGAAPTDGGAGGTGRSGSQGNGNPGSAPGGGGGGALRTSSGTRTGGNGAAGQVRIKYRYDITTTVSPATGSYGGTASLTATLTITGGGAVSGKTISFTLNSVAAGTAVTDGTGVANIPAASLAGINLGTYPTGVGASFAGIGNYKASSGTASLTVNYPMPTTTDINPTTKNIGDSQFTLTVNGTNFFSASVVRLDGADRTTTFISSTQLTAEILASDLATAGTKSITVFNPSPGGGTSNAQNFTVVTPTTIEISVPPSLSFGSLNISADNKTEGILMVNVFTL